MHDKTKSTLDQIELNIGKLKKNMEKLEILVWEDGTFRDNLWSDIMLSAILDYQP